MAGTEQSPDRKVRWISQLYYYLAALIGLSIMLFGLIQGLNGAITAALPKASDEYRYSREIPHPVEPGSAQASPSPAEAAEREARALENARLSGLSRALRGAVAAVVALPVFWWHLRQARRREQLPGSSADRSS